MRWDAASVLRVTHRHERKRRPRLGYAHAVTERLPLFPLGTVLFPGLVLPLHVFEERYRQLVRDLLTGLVELIHPHGTVNAASTPSSTLPARPRHKMPAHDRSPQQHSR